MPPWLAVGGKSYVAQLLTDANVNYYWSADSTAGGLPLSFEAVLQKQKNDDYWINANAGSLAEILSVEPRCAMFKAFQSGKVYHYNKRVNPEGGLDYYESGVVQPDVLLKDMLLIFHPGLFNADSETVYWKKLN
jgi:iron complex transport system substrate-binding protein